MMFGDPELAFHLEWEQCLANKENFRKCFKERIGNCQLELRVL